jgi:hypothetical protein
MVGTRCSDPSAHPGDAFVVHRRTTGVPKRLFLWLLVVIALSGCQGGRHTVARTLGTPPQKFGVDFFCPSGFDIIAFHGRFYPPNLQPTTGQIKPDRCFRSDLQAQAAGYTLVPLPRGYFIRASTTLLAQCRATARHVGYAVPCPTRVPNGLLPTSVPSAEPCHLDVIGPSRGGVRGESGRWRGWVFGSSETSDTHLVITASPRPIRSYAKLLDGPQGWYPAARVRLLGWLLINGWRIRSVYVPPATNYGSAFAGHVVLIWTVGDHTYGVGFHDFYGVPETLALDTALVQAVKLVAP